MRVRVDQAKCMGHGVCCVNAPDIFKIGDDDHAYVESEVVPAGREEAAQMGAQNCPEQAIDVEE
ncbi:ferredoxin [Nocardioides humi]|uniref:Ferredoxin n=1 Tax=Nocardioides humi TaxID=449461 RepID=A0ABN1ZWD2_9ACTN|nr:ferredoxin [Nocardioides humi]